jgi:hypothetical protein
MAKTSWKRAAEALDSVRPGLSAAARQILLGQAWAETKFGDEHEGTNTHNWGSIGGKGDRGSYTITDTAEGKPIKRTVAWFSTPEKGAERFSQYVLDIYKAGKYAEAGDLWGYARALWRGGPNNPELGAPSVSPGPAYYGGFPPGHPFGLAPAGVRQRSKLDDWYRVTAYARFVDGAARAAAKALGETYEGRIVLPPKPGEDSTDLLPATALGADALKPKEPETEKMSPEAVAEYEARKAEEARILEAERAEQEEGVKKAQAEIARKEAEAEAAKAKAEADAKAEAKAKTPGAPGAPPVDQAIPTAAIVVGVLGLAWLFARK